MARFVVMQPYVPAYRVPFFTALSRRLREEGHELVIASGAPSGIQARRQDGRAIGGGVVQRRLRTLVIRVGSARLRLVAGRAAWRDADVVVAELAAGATATYQVLLQRRRPVGVWGHVEAFTAPDSRLTRALRRWQARTASHVLAYSARGASTAESWGVDRSMITCVQNTLDTDSLVQAFGRVREDHPSEVRARLGVGAGPIFAIIGGLDASKRLDLVVGALDIIWASRPDIQVIVGGRGDLEAALDRGVSRGQVLRLGYVGADTKADIARVATGLLNPGRVGLIAVESMVMEVPVITTRGQRHGPEFDYLTPGSDCVQCAPTPSALASAVIALADDPTTAARLASAVGAKASEFTLDNMVDRYTAALLALLRIATSASRRP